MRELLTYALQSVVCGGVFAALYALLLERRTDFRSCRLYLLLSTALAALIPSLKIPVWDGGIVRLSAPLGTAAPTVGHASEAAPPTVVLIVWGAATVLMLSQTVRQIVRIRRLGAGAERIRTTEYEIVKVGDDIASFSFFRTIYISALVSSADTELIIAHEAGHIRHRHSAERMAMELMRAALWWNPFVWIAARRLAEVHEYEADSEVTGSGYDVSNYINTLMKHLLGYSPDIANGLRDSLTKKRLTMMTNNRIGRHALLRMLAVIPTVGGLFAAFSLTAKPARIELSNTPEPQTVVTQIRGIQISGSSMTTTTTMTLSDGTTDESVAVADLDRTDGGDNRVEYRGVVVYVEGDDAATVADPLIILDGKAVPMESIKDFDSEAIASITVLKDSEAAEAYADAGDVSNGVIIITTRTPDADR